MNHPKKVVLAVLITSAFSTTAFPAFAESDDIAQLKRQLRELTERYESQRVATEQLEVRIRRQEALLAAYTNGNAQLAQADAPARGRFFRTADGAAGDAGAAGASGNAESTSPGSGGDTLKAPPPSRSAQAVYQEQAGGVFGQPRRWTFETGLTYTHYDSRQLLLNGFLALDTIFLGNINVNRIQADMLTLDLTTRYAISDRAQVDFNAPFLYRRSNFQSGGAGGAAGALSEATVTQSPRLGDVNMGFYYKLLAETKDNPDVVWNVRLKAPTGSNPYGVKIVTDSGNNNLQYPSKLPSGNGVWTLSSGFSFIKTVDPAILFANVAYYHNFKRSFGDISSTEGTVTPGSVKLGDVFQWGVGTAFALNERSSLSLGFTQAISQRSSLQPDGQSAQTIVGSNANAATFNVGLTFASSDRTTIIGNLGIGLTPDAPNFTIGLKIPYTF